MLLKHDGITSVFVQGAEYQANEGGLFDVPDSVGPELVSQFHFVVVPVSASDSGAGGTGTGEANIRPLSKRNKTELLEECKRLNLEVPENATNAQLVELITRALEKPE